MIKALLLLLSGAKFGKLLVTSGSMLLSIFAYALIFGWPYAAGFVLLIFVHELGHYIAARQRKLPVGPITFVPFLGAWISLKEQPMNVETEAYVALAGPFAGTLAAFACYEIGKSQGSAFWLALAYAGFFLNLFNLIPLAPFDGGRISSILSRKLWLVGAPLMLGVFVVWPSPMLIIVVILAAPHLIALWQGRAAPADPRYDEVPLMTRVNYGAVYLTLAAYLAVMSYQTHEMLTHVR